MNRLQHFIDEFRVGGDIAPPQAEVMFDALLAEPSHDMLVALLESWNRKGVTSGEVAAIATIMRRRMHRINTNHRTFVDVVGTGGSRSKTFNVSTAAAFVVAGAGIPVAKHGNGAATSKTGSGDVMSALGVTMPTENALIEDCLNKVGLCFMFAPRFHRLSGELAAARRALGAPTIFNTVGPLCNPASPPHQLIGVRDQKLLTQMAEVLLQLGTVHSWLVHGADGLDEISLKAKTCVTAVTGNEVRTFEISARDFGIEPGVMSLPASRSSAESAATILQILDNGVADTDAEKLVLVNAAAAIYICGAAADLAAAYLLAEQSVRSGAAKNKLIALSEFTQQ